MIPNLGIVGAAISSLLSYWIVNILNSTKLYRLSKIHPFTINYVKPIVITIALLVMFYVLSFILKIEFWMLPLILLLFLFLYGFLLLFTRSFDEEDMDLLLRIERMAGLNLKNMKRILRRFF
jgi:O-antigen/teichoic acid export membrane protein